MFLLVITVLVSLIPPPPNVQLDSLLSSHHPDGSLDFIHPFVQLEKRIHFEGKDFKVNEEICPARFDQWNPCLSYLPCGKVIMTWCDERNGDFDIYCQLYLANGTPVGENFVVSDDLGASRQSQSSVAGRHDGFVVCWCDKRTGNLDIYARMYSPYGEPIGTSFKVNDDSADSSQAAPSASCAANGTFTICWEDRRAGNLDIYAQRYDSAGNPLGGNLKVNDDPGTASQRYPDITTDSLGGFVITWRDYRDGLYPSIFSQRYDRYGEPLGNNFMVNDELHNNAQWNPAIASDPEGNTLIVFDDWRNGNYNIYAQIYDTSGVPQGRNFLVSNDPSGSDQTNPAVAYIEQEGFVVTWLDSRDGSYDIYAQVYVYDVCVQVSVDEMPYGPNFKINDDQLLVSQLYPAVASGKKGDFTITWVDARNENWDIYAQICTPNGSTVGPNFKANDDERYASQLYPCVTSSTVKEFCVGWVDPCSGEYDIYAQILEGEDAPVGGSFLVNDDTSKAYQWVPSITSCTKSTFVMVWDDYRNSNWDIYGQMFNWNGHPLGENFLMNDDVGGAEQGFSHAASDLKNNLIVVWLDKRDEGPSRWDIYAQRFTGQGTPQGNNFRVNDDGLGNYQHSASVACDSRGDFCVAWVDARSNESDIYAQRFDSTGMAEGVNFKVNDDGAGNTQSSPSVAFDAAQCLWIVWCDSRDGNLNIYAQKFDSDGIPAGMNFRVNDDQAEAVQRNPSVAASNGHLIVSWEDYRNGTGNGDVYAQRFDDGVAVGTNYRVNIDSGCKFQGHPVVCMSNEYIYHAWQDNRDPEHGYDIYSRIEEWRSDQVCVLDRPDELLVRFCPINSNPSRRGVTVEFEIAGERECPVSLTVYCSNGSEVKRLASAAYAPGHHRIRWDGLDNYGRPIGTGVYFFTLTAPSIRETQKIVYMR